MAKHNEGLDKIINEYGGLIDKKMAAEIKDKNTTSKIYKKINVDELLKANIAENDTVSIEDKVYRIFNKIIVKTSGSTRTKRTVVLGNEGRTVRVILWDKNCDFVDSMLIQRGDGVSFSNLKSNIFNDEVELSSTSSSYIVRTVPSYDFKSDFSELKNNEKKCRYNRKNTFN